MNARSSRVRAALPARARADFRWSKPTVSGFPLRTSRAFDLVVSEYGASVLATRRWSPRPRGSCCPVEGSCFLPDSVLARCAFPRRRESRGSPVRQQRCLHRTGGLGGARRVPIRGTVAWSRILRANGLLRRGSARAARAGGRAASPPEYYDLASVAWAGSALGGPLGPRAARNERVSSARGAFSKARGARHRGCPHDAGAAACTSLTRTATRCRSHQHDTGRHPDSGLRAASAFCASTSFERRSWSVVFPHASRLRAQLSWAIPRPSESPCSARAVTPSRRGYPAWGRRGGTPAGPRSRGVPGCGLTRRRSFWKIAFVALHGVLADAHRVGDRLVRSLTKKARRRSRAP